MGQRNVRAKQVSWLALFVNIVLAVVKLGAGFLGNSVAIIADAFHSVSDCVTDIVVLWGIKEAGRPVDKSHDYGHGKIETLASLLIGLVLFAVALQLFGRGVMVIFKTVRGARLPQPGWIAFWVACLSVAIKEWLYRRCLNAGEEIDSPAMIANAWHHRSDALSSLGVMLGVGGAIVLGEPWRILDPAAAIVVSLLIARVAGKIFLRNSQELTDASLSEDIENEILCLLSGVTGLHHPHNLRTRRIGTSIAIEVHVKVEAFLSITAAHDLATAAEDVLKERFGPNTFVSVHVEPM